MSEGHNSDSYKVTATELRKYVERIEEAEKERKEQSDVIGDVKREAKSRGYDVKALTELIRRRKRERAAVKEQDAILALYEESLGIFG
jgi:uncharacterized protein (UPF0335 family)